MGQTEVDGRDLSHRPAARGELALDPPGAETVLVGGPDGDGIRLGVACARFNVAVTTRLLAGARRAWQEAGVLAEEVVVVQVPGAFELPLAARALARSGRVDAVVCLGSVIRGETSHYDLVAGQAAEGCMRVQLETGVPVAFGVVTTDSLDQAVERSGGGQGDKGAEAVYTAIEMASLLRFFGVIPAR